MLQRLAGKVAIVTGSSKGIGASIVKYMAAEGAAVVVNYSSSKDAADRIVAEIGSVGHKAVAIQADMSKKEQVERLFAEAKKAFGRLDILVNNAGIYEFAPLEDITEDNFHKQFNINVLGTILASQQAVKYFDAAGGSIINISSSISTIGTANATVYSATKGAVDALTRSLSKELGPRNIRVNTINPGLVETEGVHAAGITEGDFRKHFEQSVSLGRIGQPHDIAPMAVFLASPDASWITGESFFVNGGMM